MIEQFWMRSIQEQTR